MAVTTDNAIDREQARDLAHDAFACSDEQHRVGLELEWHVYDPDDPSRRFGPEEILAIVDEGGPLAPMVTTSPEPGGQVELDTPPLPLADAVQLARVGSAELHARIRQTGLCAVAVGADPHRAPVNLLDVPRYRAMEAAFTVRGPEGVRMMANTAAMQINLDLDPGHERWRLAHQLGPVLVAAFANSPIGPDGSTGWACHRLKTWWAIDPTRTRPVPHHGDPGAAWFTYALDANVLLIRRDGNATPVTEPLAFRAWMDQGHPLGPPTADDFAYHLTTLFPPVRPRGYLELRFLDSLDDPDWVVAAALVTALFDDASRQEALAATAPAEGQWMNAARFGLHADGLAAVADEVAEIALRGLRTDGTDPAITEAVEQWQHGPLAQRRNPADRVLEQWDSSGTVLPVGARQ